MSNYIFFIHLSYPAQARLCEVHRVIMISRVRDREGIEHTDVGDRISQPKGFHGITKSQIRGARLINVRDGRYKGRVILQTDGPHTADIPFETGNHRNLPFAGGSLLRMIGLAIDGHISVVQMIYSP